MKLLMIITDLFEEVEALATLAILRRAKLDVDLVSLYDDKAIGTHKISVNQLKRFNNINYKEYDMLVIPGGAEYIAEEKDEAFLSMVKYFAKEDKYIAAICAAPTILGHLGLLKNKKYTCFTSMNEDFGGTYIDKYVVTDGKLITARSCAASIDFALEIVNTLLGSNKCDELKKSIYYDNN